MLLPSGVQRWTRDPGFIFSKKQNHPLTKGNKVKALKGKCHFISKEPFLVSLTSFPLSLFLPKQNVLQAPQELPPRPKAGKSKLRLKGEGTQIYEREHGAGSVKEENACIRTVHLCLEAEPSTPGHTASRALAAAHCQSQHALPARPPHSAAFEPGAQEGDLPGPRLRTPCWHRPAAVAVHGSRAMRPRHLLVQSQAQGQGHSSVLLSSQTCYPGQRFALSLGSLFGYLWGRLSGIQERTQPQLNRTMSSSGRRTSHPHHRPSCDRRLSPIPSPDRQCR